MTRKKRIYGEGTITQRKDGRYQIAVPGADGKRRYAYADSEKEAEKERRRLLAEVEQGKVPASRQLFKNHVQEWLEIKQKGRGYKPNSYVNTLYCMEAHFIPALGHLPLNKLTPGHIQKLYNKMLDQELSPNTIRHYHFTLKVCLDSAVKQGKIDTNPCSKVELPKRQKSKNSYLSQEEAMRLLEAVQGHKRLDPLVPLALATQARIGELLALTWDDIDLDRGTISINKTLSRDIQQGKDGERIHIVKVVPPKTESSIRTLSLPDFAIEALRKYRTSQIKQALASGNRNKLNLLFPTEDGTYYRTDTASKCFEWFVKKLGFTITFHDLRHTGATLLLESGVEANVVQEQLGHGSIAITLGTYGHVTKRMKGKLVNNLDNLFTDDQKGKNEAI